MILTEGSEERAAEATSFLSRGGFSDRVRIEVGDGLEVIDRVGGQFDIVFNDIDKDQYPRVLERVQTLLRPGGLFISDNMLWFGTVLESEPHDASTRGVKELTRQLFDSPLFATSLIPMRDGVTVSIFLPDS